MPRAFRKKLRDTGRCGAGRSHTDEGAAGTPRGRDWPLCTTRHFCILHNQRQEQGRGPWVGFLVTRWSGLLSFNICEHSRCAGTRAGHQDSETKQTGSILVVTLIPKQILPLFPAWSFLNYGNNVNSHHLPYVLQAQHLYFSW